jgi:hypothetical protein
MERLGGMVGALAGIFVFQLKDGQALPVHPQGLIRDKKYIVHELNPLSGRSGLPMKGESLKGEALMSGRNRSFVLENDRRMRYQAKQPGQFRCV